MTGFGPVADTLDLAQSDASSSSVSLPPYVLAPVSDHGNSDGNTLEDRSRVLFCAYCLSEDQRWLIASIVRDNGEVSDCSGPLLIVNLYQ